jgi:hypothetical protein
MRYLLICYFNEDLWTSLPAAQRESILQEYQDLMQETARNGKLRDGAQLKPTNTATTVRGNNGKAVFTDGPFAETKEQLGGYHLLECKDLDEAMSIASRIPTIHVGGTIEIRPVEMSET